MAISRNIQEAQAFGYSRCAVASTMCAVEAEIYGDKECGHDCRAMFYWWGVDVLSRTLTEDCDCDDKCVTEAFACAVIRLLNPGCIECGCGSPDEIPTSCDIVADRSVYQALDASEQNTIPHVAGRQTLIVSDTTDAGNEWADHVGDIATDDGAGNYTYWTPTAGLVIYSGAGAAYYLAYAGGVGPYFPVVSGNEAAGMLTLVSEAPEVNGALGRNVLIQASADGTTWTSLYVGPEDVLESGAYVLTVNESYSHLRCVYYWGEEDECSRMVTGGTIPLSACGFDVQADYAGDALWYDFYPNTAGARFLIVSDVLSSGNPWGSHIGEIAIGDGAGGWTYEVIAAGDIVMALGDDLGEVNGYWADNGGTWQPYYPPLPFTIDDGTITLADTGYAAFAPDPRNVVIETSSDGGATWTVVFSGPESGLTGGWTGTAPADAHDVRATYFGECPLAAEVTLVVQTYAPYSLFFGMGTSNVNAITRTGTVPAVDMWPTSRSFGLYMKWDRSFSLFIGGLSAYGTGPADQICERSWMRLYFPVSGSDGTLIWYGRIDGVQVYRRNAIVSGLVTPFTDNNWHSIVVTMDGDGQWHNPEMFRVYVDGVSLTITNDPSGDVGDPSVFDGVTWDYGLRFLMYSESGTATSGSAIKNIFDSNKVLGLADIVGPVATGAIQANAFVLGIESFANLNYGDVPEGVAHRLGNTWPVPILYSPAIGPPTGLNTISANRYPVYYNVPPQLAIP